jgi:hypothetical protein
MPPLELTLIPEINGMGAVIDCINSYDLKPDEKITLNGKTYSVAQLKRTKRALKR